MGQLITGTQTSGENERKLGRGARLNKTRHIDKIGDHISGKIHNGFLLTTENHN